MKSKSLAQGLQAFSVAMMILVVATPALAGTTSPLHMNFVNENTSYGSPDNAWILFSYTGSADDEFVGTVLGAGAKSGSIDFTAGAGPSAGSYFSQVYQITDLADGVEITTAPSTRIYVSLGQAIDTKSSTKHPSNPFSEFGAPSPTATADPNWNIRWDFFETTLSDPRSPNDYGDISVINQLAIPLRVDLYDSATEQTPENLLQSAQTAPNVQALKQALTDFASAHTANNNFASLPGNWNIQTPSGAATPSNPFPNTFLRQVGPASAGTDPQWIGPFPSLNDYATFVANHPGTPITTTLTDTTSVKDTLQQSYDMTTTAWLSEAEELLGLEVSGSISTSTWNATTMTWNSAVTDPRTFEMRIALDANVGHPTNASYSLSNALYLSAWQGNTGVTYWITDGEVTTSYTKNEFLAEVSSNGTMALQTVNQWMQNFFVGYNFGLVGNTSTVSNLPAMHPLTGVSLNDMGSAGWAELKSMIDVGTISTADVPFFTLTDSQQHPLYNQWAKIVFEHTQTAYGTQYSDMFQPLLPLYTYQTNFKNNVYEETVHDVLSWKVTILAPEPEAFGTLAALGTLAVARLRRRSVRA